jgi:hypothetical protein
MGAAAEHRGNALVRRQIAAEPRPVEFQFMDELNALPKYPDAGTPFGEIRFVFSHNGWFAECPITEHGFWYRTLREAVRRWRVKVIGFDNGKWIAQPMPPKRESFDAFHARHFPRDQRASA